MSNIIKPKSNRQKSVKPFVLKKMDEKIIAEQAKRLSEHDIVENLEDTPQNRNKKEFVIDLTGQIKTDEQRLQELEKRYFSQFAKKTKQMEEKAVENGIKKVAPAIDAFKNAVLELSQVRKKFYTKVEKEILELILSISMSVVNHELTLNKDVVVNTIKHTVSEIIDQEQITIKVNPTDLEYATSCKPDIQSFSGKAKNIELKADDSVSRGGCIVESNFGDIDSRIEVNLEKIEKELRGIS